jgi:hypothetical protein
MPVTASADLQTALQKLTTGGVRKVILQPSDATGDISHVAPLLGIFADHGVLVFRSEHFDKGNYIPNVYVHEFNISQNRVAWLDAPLTKAQKGGIEGATNLTQCTTVLLAALRAGRGLGEAPDAELGNVSLLGAGKSTALSGMKAVLRGPGRFDPNNPSSEGSPSHSKDSIIDAYLRRLGILPYLANQHWVVLWGRVSSEIHIAANSSTLAIAQLARLCVDRKIGVILAGDINFEKLDTHDGKLIGQCICIGQFWKKHDSPPGADGKKRFIPLEQLCEPQLAARPDQVRLFYVLGKHLKLNAKRLVHVGMRSGGLDAYAFSGQRTLYLLPEHFGDERMGRAVDALAEVKGFAFEKQKLAAPVRQWTYAPEGKKNEGQLAFVKDKVANKPTKGLKGEALMEVKDAKLRYDSPDAERKSVAKGFQPNEDKAVFKHVLDMLEAPDKLPPGKISAVSDGKLEI